MLTFKPPVVLTFSHFDPSGMTGVSADIQTLSSLGCHPINVLTAYSISDTRSTIQLEPIDCEHVAEQARYLLEDMAVHAFKIGELGSLETAVVLAEITADYPHVPLIFDPCLPRTHHPDAEEKIAIMCDLILPRAQCLVCNPIEARWLATLDDDNEDDLSTAAHDDPITSENAETLAQQLAQIGAQHLLMTSIHSTTQDLINGLYYEGRQLRQTTWQRLPNDTRGAGDTLSAAIAAFMAHGASPVDAALQAQEYVWQALSQSYQSGMGYHMPDRFFWARDIDTES